MPGCVSRCALRSVNRMTRVASTWMYCTRSPLHAAHTYGYKALSVTLQLNPVGNHGNKSVYATRQQLNIHMLSKCRQNYGVSQDIIIALKKSIPFLKKTAGSHGNLSSARNSYGVSPGIRHTHLSGSEFLSGSSSW